MAHTPQYQLNRQELIKSIRWLSACATDERDMMVLSYCERLLVSREYSGRLMMVLSAIENGAQSRADLIEVTGFSDATIRRCLIRLERQCRIEVRMGDRRSKLYFVR